MSVKQCEFVTSFSRDRIMLSMVPVDPQRVQCPQVFQVSQARERVEPSEKLMETLTHVKTCLQYPGRCLASPPLNLLGDKEEEGRFVGGLHIFRIQQRSSGFSRELMLKQQTSVTTSVKFALLTFDSTFAFFRLQFCCSC